MNYSEIREHPEMNLEELSELTRISRTRLMVAISREVRPQPMIWDYFVQGKVPVGNLMLSERLPNLGTPLEHAVAATGSVKDFRRYVEDLHQKAIRSYTFAIVTWEEIARSLESRNTYLRAELEDAYERICKIRYIVSPNAED